jgi:hypothetical protein
VAEDFTAVPRDEWWRLRDHVGSLRLLAFAAFIAVILLVKTLIEKGVLGGWGDLVHDMSPDA